MNVTLEKNIKLLHVEDNKGFQELFKFSIQKKVNELFVAENGLDGYKSFLEYRPDIVVTDIIMPGIDGLEMARRIKQVIPDTIIIVFSSVERDNYLIDAINYGIDHFIIKDEDNFKEIVYVLDKCIEQVLLKRSNQLQSNRLHKQSQALEHSKSMILITDFNGIIEFANKSFYINTGFIESETLGQTLFCRVDENINLCWNTEETDTIGIYKHFCANGNYFWISSTISPIFNNDGIITNYVIVSEDITHRKIAEEAIIRADQARRTFLANVTHELRTPLNGVMGITSLLLDTNTTPYQEELLKLQQDSAEALLKIINNILDFSQIEDSKIVIDKAAFDLELLLNNCINFFIVAAKAKRLHLNLKIDDRINFPIIGDERRLSQILTNIIANAIKFTPKGIVDIIVDLESQEEDKVCILFTIKDTGIGIPNDFQARIFERFTQVDDSLTRKYGGLGLGLAISKELIELMNGNIWVSSTEGIGSNFYFELVFDYDKNLKISKHSTTQNQYQLLTEPLRILLAEDNRMNQKVVVSYLKKYGHEIQIANNGQEAIELYKNNTYDIILMDVEMPIINGLTATHEIREIEKTNNTYIPIIAITAFSDFDTKNKCFYSGMDDFVTKPVDFQLLNETIAKIINKKRISTSPDYFNTISIDSSNNFDTDYEFKQKVIILFVEEIPNLVENLRYLLKLNDFENLKYQIFKLKSVLEILKAEKAFNKLVEFENLMKNKELSNAKTCFSSLVIESIKLVNKLNNYLNRKVRMNL